MKEVLYTIPVNDAFHSDCECPICVMHRSLEQDAVQFTMGPSYMADDIRAITDKLGFCSKHMKQLYDSQNRLGLALILNTHLKKTMFELEKQQKKGAKISTSLFKKTNTSGVNEYINELDHSCFICDRIEKMFERYLITIFHSYQEDEDFRRNFKTSKGFCTTHYGLLYEMAPLHLSNPMCAEFISALNQSFMDNLKRVQEDLSWFIDKFDYRNSDAPWKNSKDALPRVITKINSILE